MQYIITNNLFYKIIDSLKCLLHEICEKIIYNENYLKLQLKFRYVNNIVAKAM